MGQNLIRIIDFLVRYMQDKKINDIQGAKIMSKILYIFYLIWGILLLREKEITGIPETKQIIYGNSILNGKEDSMMHNMM